MRECCRICLPPVGTRAIGCASALKNVAGCIDMLKTSASWYQFGYLGKLACAICLALYYG